MISKLTFIPIFATKVLDRLNFFLGIKVVRGPLGLFLCRQKYALEIADECGLLGSRPLHFPMEENHNLSLAMGQGLTNPSSYQRLVRRLIYLTIT